jgi:hypothetical protein
MHLDGILGSNFFHDRVVELNYPCRTVALLDDAVLEPFTARFSETPSGWIETTDVFVNGKRVTATFDTGNSGTPVVTRRGIATLHLSAAAATGPKTQSFSYGGLHRETDGVLSSVFIGTLPIGSSRARFLTSADNSFDVNLGNRALQDYIATFDYVRGLLTLRRARSCP